MSVNVFDNIQDLNDKVETLTRKNKALTEEVMHVNSISTELQHAVDENKRLASENAVLKTTIEDLTGRIEILTGSNKDLTTKISQIQEDASQKMENESSEAILKLETDLQTMGNRNNQLSAKLQRSMESVQKQKSIIKHLHSDITTFIATIEEKTNTRIKSFDDIISLIEQNATLAQALEELNHVKSQNESVTHKLATVKEINQTLQEKVQTLQQEKQQLNRQLVEYETKLISNNSSIKQSVLAQSKHKEQFEERLSQLQSKLSIAQETMQNEKIKRHTLQQQNKQLAIKISEQQTEKRKLEQKIVKIKGQLMAVIENQKAFEIERGSYESQLDEFEARLKNAASTISQLKTEISLKDGVIKQLRDDLEKEVIKKETIPTKSEPSVIVKYVEDIPIGCFLNNDLPHPLLEVIKSIADMKQKPLTTRIQDVMAEVTIALNSERKRFNNLEQRIKPLTDSTGLSLEQIPTTLQSLQQSLEASKAELDSTNSSISEFFEKMEVKSFDECIQKIQKYQSTIGTLRIKGKQKKEALRSLLSELRQQRRQTEELEELCNSYRKESEEEQSRLAEANASMEFRMSEEMKTIDTLKAAHEEELRTYLDMQKQYETAAEQSSKRCTEYQFRIQQLERTNGQQVRKISKLAQRVKELEDEIGQQTERHMQVSTELTEMEKEMKKVGRKHRREMQEKEEVLVASWREQIDALEKANEELQKENERLINSCEIEKRLKNSELAVIIEEKEKEKRREIANVRAEGEQSRRRLLYEIAGIVPEWFGGENLVNEANFLDCLRKAQEKYQDLRDLETKLKRTLAVNTRHDIETEVEHLVSSWRV